MHVPDTNIYPSERTARGLERVLDLCMAQIRDMDRTTAMAEQLRDAKLSETDDDEVIGNGLDK